MSDGREELLFITDKVKQYGGMERLGRIFHTPKQAYFYDSGTGKVECLNESEERFFEWLFERKEQDGYEQWCDYNSGMTAADMLIETKNAIQKENLLMSPFPMTMISPRHQVHLKQELDQNLRLITLELTERCNLRCGYCIYNEGFQENRNFSDYDMSEATAMKAIQYLAGHSGQDVAVTFYGGEPLLKLELLKTCVEYSKEVMCGKNLTFSMTSNMTLMTRELAEYFYGIDHFYLLASLDGPEEIHNSYRKYADGRGSFADTLRGLKILTEVFGDAFASRVSLSMVFTPPYTYERVEKIRDFYEHLSWLPRDTEKLLSYPENGSVQYKIEDADGVSVEEEQDKEYVDTLYKWSAKNMENNLQGGRGMFTKKVLDDILLKVHKRPLVNKPSTVYGLNGCCIPGTRRLYVTAGGDYKACEHVGVSPLIGNVEQGLNYEDIKRQYVDEYIRESEKLCSECWANMLCGVCYAKTYALDGINMEKKNFECDMSKHVAEQGLVSYHTILEENPSALQYLNDIEFG